ncbi:MAG: hypothetical protein QOJ60_2685 [Actinomycetota bacterium]|nr:hypothetical protein [Actinomycetota bacterium]
MSDRALGATEPVDPPTGPTEPVPVESGRIARRIGVTYLVLSVVLVPWIFYLAWSLPPESVAHHYDVAWPGFDVLLVLGLAGTGACAWLRSRYLAVAAAATGSMLLVDAWFDVTTAGAHERWVSLGLAVVVEIPLATVCLLLAVRAQDVMADDARRRGPGQP